VESETTTKNWTF